MDCFHYNFYKFVLLHKIRQDACNTVNNIFFQVFFSSFSKKKNTCTTIMIGGRGEVLIAEFM